jgi:hypothetical protein
MSRTPNALSYLLPTYREDLLSNVFGTVEVQQLFTTFLSSRSRALGSAWVLLQVEHGVVEGVESLSPPRRQLKPDQYVKHDGNRKATDRTSSIETAAHDL